MCRFSLIRDERTYRRVCNVASWVNHRCVFFSDTILKVHTTTEDSSRVHGMRQSWGPVSNTNEFFDIRKDGSDDSLAPFQYTQHSRYNVGMSGLGVWAHRPHISGLWLFGYFSRVISLKHTQNVSSRKVYDHAEKDEKQIAGMSLHEMHVSSSGVIIPTGSCREKQNSVARNTCCRRHI